MALSALTRDSFEQATSGVTTSGGTAVMNIATHTDKGMRLRAVCMFSAASASHLANFGSLTAEYVVQNKNGTLTATAAATSSFNPINSNTTVATGYIGKDVQADDHAALNGICTLTWSVSGTNAVCTFTNNSSTTALNVIISIDTWESGST